MNNINYTSDAWIRDTGLVITLIALIFAYRGFLLGFVVAFILLVALLVAPRILVPFAFVWAKITELLGSVVPRIFFGLVFFVIITPIGVIQRLAKRNILRSFVKEESSVFVHGSGMVEKRHVEKPF